MGDREAEDMECNQIDQNQAHRKDTSTGVAVFPQTKVTSKSKHDRTKEMRENQESDEMSMEEGEFNKMVGYYTEIGMTEEMIAEDDLLDDLVIPETQAGAAGLENEQIEAIARLGERREASRRSEPMVRQSKDFQDKTSLPVEGSSAHNIQKGVLKVHAKAGVKKVAPRSPDTKGVAARGRLSPKSKGMKNTRSSTTARQDANQVPRTEVFPSAVKGKKTLSSLDSVVSHKPPSKRI